MANVIKIKKSSTAAKVPVAGDLEQGELAINTTDEKLFTKNTAGTVVQLNADTWRGLGTTSTTACAGDDSRLSDARTPSSHTHDYLGSTAKAADSDKLDGVDSSGFVRFYNDAVLNSSTTTASFLSELETDYGCFGDKAVALKVQWSYAGSSDLVTGDSIVGTIELAGCLIETWGGAYKHVRVTRPTTGAGGERVCVYNDQGSGYAPSWRMIWTSDTDGAGSGLDADTVSGYSVAKSVPSDALFTDTPYTHPTTAGNKHIPTGGTVGQVLKNTASGTAAWAADTNTTYSADGDYGMTLSGTAFRLEDDRRRNSSSTDIWSGNTHDYTWYDASVGIRWYTAGTEDMRLTDAGDLHVDGDITAYSTTVSDERLKHDIKPIENALDKVGQLNGCTFTYNADGKESAGLIAQDVEKVLPSAVTEKELPLKIDDGNEYKVLQYDQTIGLLVEAIKELTAKVNELEAR
jgi:hypothetical protein